MNSRDLIIERLRNTKEISILENARFDTCSTSGMKLYINRPYIVLKSFESDNRVKVKKGETYTYQGKKSAYGYSFQGKKEIILYNPEDLLMPAKTAVDEYDIFDEEAYSENLNEDFEGVNEASVVTFDKKTYPKFGWACIMAGGPGSGKGYTLKHKVAIDAKIFNVDDLKELYVKTLKRGKDTSLIKQGEDKKDFDFKNPEDVTYLHNVIDKKGFLKKSENMFYSDAEERKSAGRIPNVVYDITGSKASKLKNIGKMLKDMGYKTSLVWVVTNREVAMLQNLARVRTVSDFVLHDTHNKVNQTVFPFLQSVDAEVYDEAWVVFSSGVGLKTLTKQEVRELAEDSVIKLNKKGSSFTIPEDVVNRVISVLGDNEENPENVTTYRDSEDIKKDLEPYKVLKTIKDYDGSSKTITSYSDKNKKYDGLSFRKNRA